MKVYRFLFALITLCCLGSCQNAKVTKEKLYNAFQNPPAISQPRVWWHWMNGNITKDGISKDLHWMKRSGIAGFMNFDAGMSTPQIVPERLIYMDPGWKDAFAYATALADSLGLEMSVASAPGWSFTGGPWVKPQDGMKKLVWREVWVKGGSTFDGQLPEPYKVVGKYQNIPLRANAKNGYYEDIAVLAYKLDDNDIPMTVLKPKITSSSGSFTLEELTDGDLTNNRPLYAGRNGLSWIQYSFKDLQTIKAVTVVDGRVRSQWGAPVETSSKFLAVSNNGVNYTKVVDIPNGSALAQTVSFEPVTGRYFRVMFRNNEVNNQSTSASRQVSIRPTMISELVLYPVTRINHAEEKAGFASPADLQKYETPSTTDAVKLQDVIDLTEKVKDGKLTWNVPEGNWKIVRFGYSLTGKENHPAPPEATGLEVDKMDARAVRDYFEHYISMYMDASKGMMGKRGVQYMLTDSYEAEQETWTPLMREEFEKRRGYNLLPWLPVLTGAVVNSAGESERFLWDWRKTIGELVVENHYDQLTEILKPYHMGRYSESQENGRVYLADGMEVKRTATYPMSAAWMPNRVGASTPTMSQADIRESASVAHIYGQNINAAESLTTYGLEGTAWSFYPGNLKPIADMEMASGLNRFVIHTSPHQPVDDKFPGLGLGPYGQWFDRHDTWAENAKSWTDYLGRSCYLLQQGKFVADILYYYGEDNNITGLFGGELPKIPTGYNYDFINSDALTHLLGVKKNMLVTPSGMSYKVLFLDKNVRRMSMVVLRKLAELAKKGAVICGKKPEIPASLLDSQKEFNDLINQIWNMNRPNVYDEAVSLQEVLQSQGVQPDVALVDDSLRFVHRSLPKAEIYWVNNPTEQSKHVELSFRVSDKLPEVWHPETGEKEAVSYRIQDGRTVVTLDMVEQDALFVIFAGKAKEKEVILPKIEKKELMTIDGPWKVSFQEKRGAPATMTMENLTDFTLSSDPGVRYFSGTAIYSKEIELIDSLCVSDAVYFLDLGDVRNMAEVFVNGESMGFYWKAPYIVPLTSLQKGKNKLEIKVTNQWVNRLIGDVQPNVKEKITYTAAQFYEPNAPLLPSGLLGPVKLYSKK